jgi:hypothetical protein
MKPQFKLTRPLAAACAMATLACASWAAPSTAPAECGLIGSWSGYETGDLYWLGTHSPGTYPTSGTMQMDWTYVSPSLLSGAARLTNGRGVWELVRKGQYRYTWYAYGLDASGGTFYTVRVSGLAQNTDCNNVQIGYKYEIFYPPVEPALMSSAVPVEVKTGTAYEKRLLQAPATP